MVIRRMRWCRGSELSHSIRKQSYDRSIRYQWCSEGGTENHFCRGIGRRRRWILCWSCCRRSCWRLLTSALGRGIEARWALFTSSMFPPLSLLPSTFNHHTLMKLPLATEGPRLPLLLVRRREENLHRVLGPQTRRYGACRKCLSTSLCTKKKFQVGENVGSTTAPVGNTLPSEQKTSFPPS